MSQPKFATCTLCEAICGIAVETSGERVTSIRGDAEDPFSRGHICPKAAALKDLHEDPDRLRRPMIREGTTFREASWDEALDRAASGLRDVQSRSGRDAVAVYQGNPTVHSLGAMLFAPPFVRALRTKVRFSATSVDQLPQMLAAFAMFGHQFLLPIPDIDRTDHLLVFGANPVVSNGSLMTAPDVAHRLEAILARRGRIIVLDPRRTETAKLAGEHHFIRPGTDALALLAMVNTLFAEGLLRPGPLADFTDGFSTLREATRPFSPERVAPATGLSADTLRTLARDFAAAERAACYGRVGICAQDMGGVASWLINVLNILTGRLDAPGGALFTKPALDIVGMRLVGPGGFGRWKSRVRGLPEFGGELPVATLAEEIETPGEGQLRALVTSAGNPVLSTPNGRRLDRALASLDFMVSMDIYLNETTRHAHVILPPTGPLERDHYDAVFHALAIRNTARFSPAVFPKPEGAMHDWEIFSALTERLGGRARTLKSLRSRAELLVTRRLGPRSMVDLGLRMGPYGGKLSPLTKGMSLRHLLQNPHGVDLGPLAPSLPGRLATRDRRIRLAPDLFLADLPRIERTLESLEASAGLLLIGRRALRSNNSWMHNSPMLVKGPARCTLKIAPPDAESRGLAQGDRARVTSRTGTIEVAVDISSEMMPGVVCLPHGWGHHREGTRLSVASAHAGESFNDLADEAQIDPLSGNASLNGIPVTVARA
ncbi:MAG: molybdopterin oxidoreductase family protein [Polyangiaceae bacterium]